MHEQYLAREQLQSFQRMLWGHASSASDTSSQLLVGQLADFPEVRLLSDGAGAYSCSIQRRPQQPPEQPK
ncbi:MAG TPA: hypothetical protein VF940_04375 [Streptosporangiaceae bacterium]